MTPRRRDDHEQRIAMYCSRASGSRASGWRLSNRAAMAGSRPMLIRRAHGPRKAAGDERVACTAGEHPRVRGRAKSANPLGQRKPPRKVLQRLSARPLTGRLSENDRLDDTPPGQEGDDVTMVTMISDSRRPLARILFFFLFSDQKRKSIFTSSPTFASPLFSRPSRR